MKGNKKGNQKNYKRFGFGEDMGSSVRRDTESYIDRNTNGYIDSVAKKNAEAEYDAIFEQYPDYKNSKEDWIAHYETMIELMAILPMAQYAQRFTPIFPTILLPTTREFYRYRYDSICFTEEHQKHFAELVEIRVTKWLTPEEKESWKKLLAIKHNADSQYHAAWKSYPNYENLQEAWDAHYKATKDAIAVYRSEVHLKWCTVDSMCVFEDHLRELKKIKRTKAMTWPNEERTMESYKRKQKEMWEVRLKTWPTSKVEAYVKTVCENRHNAELNYYEVFKNHPNYKNSKEDWNAHYSATKDVIAAYSEDLSEFYLKWCTVDPANIFKRHLDELEKIKLRTWPSEKE